jgi:hypothetical protein
MTDYNPSALTPTTLHELPEVRTAEELGAVVGRLMQNDIPGFVIRNTGDIYGGHQEAMGALESVLVSDGHIPNGHQLNTTYEMSYHSSADDDETVSDWHFDDPPRPEAEDYGLHFHTTTSGAAHVKLAKPGPELQAKLARYAPDSLKQAIKDNTTDATVMDPHIHEGKVEPGDMVVFPTSGRSPAWHSFQTDPEVRSRTTNLRGVHIEAIPSKKYGVRLDSPD